MLKLYINPPASSFSEDGSGSGGICRVVTAQAKYLPVYGVELVDAPEKADVVAIHAGALVDTDKPIVSHNHGLYWTFEQEWPRDFWEYNTAVIETLRRASIITTPSEWVAQSIRRGLKASPVVIPHGIDLAERLPVDNRGYVLWAKPRIDIVSNPAPMNRLAELASDVQFLSTFGRPTPNVKIVGCQPYDEFQETLKGAAVWLATARETGDIASREAMMYGIPVLCWNHGATAELIEHKITGYIANNDADMLEGLRYCLAHRDELGKNAREAVKRYQWKDIMGQYAAVYQQALDINAYPVEVSVIVPTYNYARFLPECLSSIGDFESLEVIVVDDCSTDNTQEVLTHFPNVKVIRHEVNAGLVAALNTGHNAARGRYLINLDADNRLCKGAIKTLYDAMQAHPWIDVGCGYYRILGTDRVHGGPVNPNAHLEHANQIPSTCIIRSRSVRRVGGYRARQRKNEDAEFWCRAISAGLRCENVTDKVVFEYRWHGDNKSAAEGGEDDPNSPLSWNFYYPWHIFPDITPYGSTTNPVKASWVVPSFEQPHISVVIPVGPGHAKFLPDALDSVYAQTFQGFECVIANDTGEPLDVATMGHPWVRVVDTNGREGAAIARNTAIAAARSPLIVPLDADDILYPDTLATYYRAWLEYPDSIVYADCFTEDEPGKTVYYHSGNWSISKIREEAIYQDVILFAKQWWEAVGGYDVDIIWEDWIFGLKLHLLGVGATYIEQPWGVYRHWTSLENGASNSDTHNADYGTPAFKERLDKIYDWIDRKEEALMCKGCSGRAATRVYKTPVSTLPADVAKLVNEGKQISVICVSAAEGLRSLNSKATPGKKYRYKSGTILLLDRGDEWVARHKEFELYVPDEVIDVPQLPKIPPVVVPIPVSSPPPPVAEKIDPVIPIESLDLSEALIAKLKAAGFNTKADLHKDITTTAGEKIKAIKGIGPKSLVDIRKAVLGA